MVPAGTPLFEIGDPTDIDIVLELLSADAVKVTPGATASIDGAGLSGPLTAKVRRVEQAGFTKVSALGIEEQRVKTFLDFDQSASARERLGHDYRVFARITIWDGADTLRVPLSALFRNGTNWAVYKVNGNRVALTPVEIGHHNTDHAQVLGGLAPRDSVVLHPSDRVKQGTRVRQIVSAPTR